MSHKLEAMWKYKTQLTYNIHHYSNIVATATALNTAPTDTITGLTCRKFYYLKLMICHGAAGLTDDCERLLDDEITW